MIKKLSAYSFILLANIVLLVHAVLPHHHHKQQVCIEVTHCVDDEIANIYNTPTQDHQHDGNTNSTECVLKKAVVFPSTQSRILKDCDNCPDSHNHDFYFLSNFRYSNLNPISEVAKSFPVSPCFLTSFVTSTLGSRAPPIV